MQQAIDAVINSTSESDLNGDLNTLLASKSWTLLDNCEYMALEVFCQVAKSSGTYWKQNNPKPASGKWSFGKFIASDALGAYGGFLRFVVLAPVPGANSVIAVSAAWGVLSGLQLLIHYLTRVGNKTIEIICVEYI